MLLKLGVIFFVLLFVIDTKADEVLLKNGTIWTNVNILEKEETENTVTIYTSKNKKIEINKNEISGIKKSKFNTAKESILSENNLSSDELVDFDRIKSANAKQSFTGKQDTTIYYQIAVIDTQLLKLPKVRIKIGLGYSYRTAKTPSNVPTDVKDYIGDLKKGGNFNISLSYFFSGKNGISFNYNRFSSSNSITNINWEMDGVEINSTEDNMTISFLGVGWIQRSLTSQGKILLIGNASLGSIAYNNDSKVNNIPLSIEGSTFGVHVLFGMEYFLSEKVGVGIDISYLMGNMKSFKVNGFDVSLGEDGESLSRFDFNIGVRLYL